MPDPRVNGAVPGGLYAPTQDAAVLAVSAGTWLVKARGSRAIVVEHIEPNLLGDSWLISDGRRRRGAAETRGD